MKKLVCAATAALSLAALAPSAGARPADRVLVTLAPRGALAAPHELAAGTHTLVLRNRGARACRLGIARVPGGTEGLVRFEGLYFLPQSGRVVHDLGLVAAGRTTSARVRIRAGSYLVVAMEGIVVAAATTLRVS
jgi:hypothetical protein